MAILSASHESGTLPTDPKNKNLRSISITLLADGGVQPSAPQQQVVTVPPIGPDELPPPYTPMAPGSQLMINCKVCQAAVNIDGKQNQHVVKCNVCNEATVSIDHLACLVNTHHYFWMAGRLAILHSMQQYFSHQDDGRVIMKGCLQQDSITEPTNLLSVGVKFGNIISAVMTKQAKTMWNGLLTSM